MLSFQTVNNFLLFLKSSFVTSVHFISDDLFFLPFIGVESTSVEIKRLFEEGVKMVFSAMFGTVFRHNCLTFFIIVN